MNLTSLKILKRIRKISLLISAAMLVTISFVAKADYKSEIIESCQAYQLGTDKDHVNACKLYIDGFIDAALFTESALVVNDKGKNDSAEKSAFMQRVYQTRSTRRISSQLDNINYQFCLEYGDDRALIASKIAKSLVITDLQTKPLKQILSETLRNVFPCE